MNTLLSASSRVLDQYMSNPAAGRDSLRHAHERADNQFVVT
jgi:hypothetical protein